MGQFDKFIKANRGQHGEEVTVRPEQRAIAKNLKTGEETDILESMAQTNQGGAPSIPSDQLTYIGEEKPNPITEKNVAGREARELNTTTMRMSGDQPVDVDLRDQRERKPAAARPRAKRSSDYYDVATKFPAKGPFVTSKQFDAARAAKAKDEEANLASTTMRLGEPKFVYDENGKASISHDVYDLEDKEKEAREKAAIPATIKKVSDLATTTMREDPKTGRIYDIENAERLARIQKREYTGPTPEASVYEGVNPESIDEKERRREVAYEPIKKDESVDMGIDWSEDDTIYKSRDVEPNETKYDPSKMYEDRIVGPLQEREQAEEDVQRAGQADFRRERKLKGKRGSFDKAGNKVKEKPAPEPNPLDENGDLKPEYDLDKIDTESWKTIDDSTPEGKTAKEEARRASELAAMRTTTITPVYKGDTEGTVTKEIAPKRHLVGHSKRETAMLAAAGKPSMPLQWVNASEYDEKKHGPIKETLEAETVTDKVRIPGDVSYEEGPVRPAQFTKKPVEKTGNVVPLEALNTSADIETDIDEETENQKRIRANRSPNPHTSQVDFNRLPDRPNYGSTEGEKASRGRFYERNKKAGGSIQPGKDDAAIKKIAVGLPEASNMSVEQVNHPMFRRGDVWAKAFVLHHSGAKLEDLNAHLGNRPNQASATLKMLYKTFQNRAQFEADDYEYSNERGNLMPESTHFWDKKGNLVPLTNLTHPDNPLKGNPEAGLKGSQVGFNGFAVDNKGRTTRIQHDSGSALHEGWHPYEVTHPQTGAKVRVMEYHTLPKNKIHDADIAEQAIATGKTHSQVLRDLAGGEETNILVNGLSAQQAPDAPIKGAKGRTQEDLLKADQPTSTTMQPSVVPGGEAWDTETYTGRTPGKKKATAISEELRNSAVSAPLAGVPYVTPRVAVSQGPTGGAAGPATEPVVRELTSEESGTTSKSRKKDDSRNIVPILSKESDEDESGSIVDRLSVGPKNHKDGQQWTEVKE